MTVHSQTTIPPGGEGPSPVVRRAITFGKLWAASLLYICIMVTLLLFVVVIEH